ncbi:ZinT family metal-binding protein [Pseudodonghicola flavimaris]|uniref:Metal-binding protein ZinT n=1 Tax=Pseudodonghicola flavimaris TaxID=3050036 RepID=A0ABT7EXR3_9RHOB|nr:metal-binding protein ZinT [Pseudodonghicola flavimaris]MDK3017137.1 metal-binding protein ZinT [Pseudodonghicola flavimaris]
MKQTLAKRIGALTLTALLGTALQAAASGTTSGDHSHDHAHDHSHADAQQKQIYKGYFEDSQIAPRPLSDWEGDWQSVFPYLMDGTLDPVMADKAAHGSKTAEGYKAYYQIGYQTDVDRIVIDGDQVSFHTGDNVVTGTYADDGYEVLTYKKGNRGVRFVFAKTAGDDDAPGFIQFSDHAIAPNKAGHYHLYWGDDRAALLQEVTNWPTYYPSTLSGDQIVHEMMAH